MTSKRSSAKKPKEWLDKGATFSECKSYRYQLWRQWAYEGRWAHFCMLNPSTADHEVEDPTVSRCIQYAKDNGYAGTYITNLFAFRSTDPKALYSHPNPVGPDNDAAIIDAYECSSMTICAWGTHGALHDRGEQVLKMLGPGVCCLKLTKDGFPGHPLYLKRDLKPMLISMAREIQWLEKQPNEDLPTIGRGGRTAK